MTANVRHAFVEYQVIQICLGRDLEDQIGGPVIGVKCFDGGGPVVHGRLQLVRQNIVLLRPFFGDQAFHGPSKRGNVPVGCGFYQTDQDVCSGHGKTLFKKLNSRPLFTTFS